MNPVQQARQAAFQQTLLSARRTMMMSEILKLALDSFRTSKLRFALTALGMVIGTASVILVVTIGMKGKQYVLDTLQKIGTNSVEIEYSGGGATGAERVMYNDSLTREDEKAVDAQLPGVVYRPSSNCIRASASAEEWSRTLWSWASARSIAIFATCWCLTVASSTRSTMKPMPGAPW
jgi:hypothetical protein